MKYHFTTDVKMAVIAAIAAFLYSTSASAAKPPSSPAGTTPLVDLCESSGQDGCSFQAEGNPAVDPVVLTWTPFDSPEFSVFGYDVYYGDPGEPGSNPNRIETGARSPMTDALDGYQTRCNLGQYHVRAYTRGRKLYSEALQASGLDTCGGDGGGGGGGGGGTDDDIDLTNAGINFGDVMVPVCAANQELRFDRSLLALSGPYKGVFTDQFNSLASVGENWDSAYAWGPETIINNEGQYYIDQFGVHASDGYWSPFEIISPTPDNSNSYLVIKAKETVDVNMTALTTQPFVSGVLTTRGLHDFTYGYFEARAKVAEGNGTWTAFWLNHTSFRRNKPEADIIEYLGQSQEADGSPKLAGNKPYNTYETQYHTYWYGKRRKRTEFHYTNSKKGETPEWCGNQLEADNYPNEGEYIPELPIDFSAGFHTYGFLWEPDLMVWYIDDVEVFRIPNAQDNLTIASEDMYMVLNLAVGSNDSNSWPGEPDEYTKTLMDTGEVNMIVDYVKVYQK